MNDMRSREVAELAGVSVRTLRHYHQVGVLPEPDRGPNNYRHYTLAHVARLLRVRRLAALGVSLDLMPRLLDDLADEQTAQLLDDLDHELEARIEDLSQRRNAIAQLRADQRRPDLPPGLEALDGVVGPLGSNDVVELERDASLVLAQVAQDAHEPDAPTVGGSDRPR